MVAIKAYQAQAFLNAPDPKIRAVLFFGSDAGLASERAAQMAARAAQSFNPPGEVIRLDDQDLETDPDRLVVELNTVPMFGGPKVIRTVASRRVSAAALKPLLEGGALEGVLIVEAGNLKPDDTLRALFEKSPAAAAVACYADGAQDLEGLIRDILREAGVTIAPDARGALVERLGADRALSRGEIEKLVLFVGPGGAIGIDEVEAIVGDVSEMALDRVTNAAAGGQAQRAVAECGRAVSAGESPQAIIAATQRHFQRLHRARAALDRGSSLDDVLRQMRPPLHFKQKDAFAAQVRLWTRPQLDEALARIGLMAKAARLQSSLETALSERLVMGLALMVERGTGARGR